MSEIKEHIINIVQDQPEDSSFEEILREIAFEKMIRQGLADSEANRVVSNKAVKEKIMQWQK